MKTKPKRFIRLEHSFIGGIEGQPTDHCVRVKDKCEAVAMAKEMRRKFFPIPMIAVYVKRRIVSEHFEI